MNRILYLVIITLLICDVNNNFYREKEEKEKIHPESNYDDLILLSPNMHESNNSDNIPESFDWREKNIIFPKYQDSPYSTQWKHPTIEMLETLYAIKKEKLYSFSSQMILDCLFDINDSIEDTLNWIKRYGIILEADYPYKGTKGACKIIQSKYIDMKVKGYIKLSPYADEELMKKYLYKIGPLTVGINNKFDSYYKGDIIDLNKEQCPPTDINQAVVLVGYGTTSGKDYWIVKTNSGKLWGNKGYLRFARGKGVCGINQYVIIPNIEFE